MKKNLYFQKSYCKNLYTKMSTIIFIIFCKYINFKTSTSFLLYFFNMYIILYDFLGSRRHICKWKHCWWIHTGIVNKSLKVREIDNPRFRYPQSMIYKEQRFLIDYFIVHSKLHTLSKPINNKHILIILLRTNIMG